MINLFANNKQRLSLTITYKTKFSNDQDIDYVREERLESSDEIFN